MTYLSYIDRYMCFYYGLSIRGGSNMFKKLALMTTILLTSLFMGAQAILAAGGGAAEDAAHAEPSGLITGALTALSIVTLAFMIFLSFRDNG